MLFRKRTVKAARKERQCFGCLVMIPTGSRAQEQVGINSMNFWAITFCEACAAWLDDHRDFWEAYPDGCLPGDVGEARAALAAVEKEK